VANLVLQLAVREPGIEVVIFAPSFRQAKVLSRKVRYMLAGSPWEDRTTVDNVRELRLGFGTDEDGKPVESVIMTMSLSGKARGEGADVLVVDESAFCDPEDYRNKALPFVVDRPEAVIVHISTVWAEDDHFMQAYERYGDLEEGATFRTPTRMKPGVTEAMLEEFRESMLRSEFEREYECNLVPEGGVFDRRAIKDCLDDYEPVDLAGLSGFETDRRAYYYVGVDWGKFQDQTVVAGVEQPTQHKENPCRLVFLEVYDPDPDDPNHYQSVIGDVLTVAGGARCPQGGGGPRCGGAPGGGARVGAGWAVRAVSDDRALGGVLGGQRQVLGGEGLAGAGDGASGGSEGVPERVARRGRGVRASVAGAEGRLRWGGVGVDGGAGRGWGVVDGGAHRARWGTW
jgi:hypothetical protein